MNTFEELERDEGESATSCGGWILTYTGKQFSIELPEAADVCIEDIAHSLSLLCRFTGHCLRFYSVAEHSLLVARQVPKKFQAWALLHDAAEAYVNDLARPLKTRKALADYREIEQRVLRTIFLRFGLYANGEPVWVPEEVKLADLRALATERRDLMPPVGPDWDLRVEPFPELISPYDRSAQAIKNEFLNLAMELGIS